MKLGIYRNGKKDVCRVYFGEIQTFLKGSANWEEVYSEEIKTDKTPRELGNYLINFNNLKIHEYVDGSIPSRFGMQFDIDARTLACIIEETFPVSLAEKSL
ncbi:MAG: hypothetical protein AABX93_02060 [Nanoarchaeota archaeon]